MFIDHRRWARAVQREKSVCAKVQGQRVWGLGTGDVGGGGRGEGMRLACRNSSHSLSDPAPQAVGNHGRSIHFS